MVHARMCHKIDGRAAGAGFRVRGSIDDTRDARVHERSDAHHARLQRNVQRATEQTIVAQRLTRRSQHQDLGVSGWIVACDRRVRRARHYYAPRVDEHRAHGNLISGVSVSSTLESQRHVRQFGVCVVSHWFAVG